MSYPTPRRYPRTLQEAFGRPGDGCFTGPYRRRSVTAADVIVAVLLGVIAAALLVHALAS